MHDRTLRIVLTSLSLWVADASAQTSLFTWQLDVPNGASGTLTEQSMTIVGPDLGFAGCSAPGSTAAFRSTAPVAGIVLVRIANWTNADKGGPGYDHPVFEVAGEMAEFPEAAEGSTVAFKVPKGATFGFGVHSEDCIAGPGTLTIDSFEFLAVPLEISFAAAGADEQFGAAVADAGDRNGDGTHDAFVGAPRAATLSGVKVGRVDLRSSQDSSVMAQLFGNSANDEFGAAIATLGDVDGDGLLDCIVGAPKGDGSATDQGTVSLFTGATPSLKFTVHGAAPGDRFGSAVAAIGDVDSDGVPDLGVGAPNADAAGVDSGATYEYSGATGALLRVRNGGAANDRFGTSLASAGDFDADGFSDLLVGAPGVDGPNLFNQGNAYVYAAASSAPLANYPGAPSNEHFGTSVSPIGDSNVAGRDDVAIGAPHAIGGGRVEARTFGATNPLWVAYGPGNAAQFGFTVTALQNVDDDGSPDLAVGAPTLFHGSVSILRLRDGVRTMLLPGRPNDTSFGRAIAPLGDFDGDGRTDVLVGAPLSAGNAGRAEIDALRWTWLDLGHSVPGSVGRPRLGGSGILASGTVAHVQLLDAPPNATTFLVIGTEQGNQPFLGGILVPLPALVLGPFLTAASGKHELDGIVRPGMPAGIEISMQNWIADPSAPFGFAASNGLRARIP